MILRETLCILLLVLTTACQFSPKLSYPKDEMYGDGTQVFIHHSRPAFSDEFEVYIDKKRFDPDLLDRKGIRILKGEHGIDIVDKKSSRNRGHFDVTIDDSKEKHFDLCNINPNADFALEEKSQSTKPCIPNNLN